MVESRSGGTTPPVKGSRSTAPRQGCHICATPSGSVALRINTGGVAPLNHRLGLCNPFGITEAKLNEFYRVLHKVPAIQNSCGTANPTKRGIPMPLRGAILLGQGLIASHSSYGTAEISLNSILRKMPLLPSESRWNSMPCGMAVNGVWERDCPRNFVAFFFRGGKKILSVLGFARLTPWPNSC